MEGQSSTALSKKGQQQTSQLTNALCATSPWPTHLYSSPLLRAQQTADAIATALTQIEHPFTYRETEALCEMHQGIFQGLSWAQAKANYPDLCAQLMTTLSWQPIPEAETLLAARNRAKSWFQHLLENHSAGDTIWAVSHEGFLQHLVSVVMGCDRTWQLRIPHTAIFEFWLALPAADDRSSLDEFLKTHRFNPECWRLRRFNDCDHIAENPTPQI